MRLATPLALAACLSLTAACTDDQLDDASGRKGNTRPLADAGANRLVSVGEPAVLNGSGSHDRESELLLYRWSFVQVPDGSAASFAQHDVVNPAFVPDVAGNYRIALVVSDGELDSPPAFVTLQADLAGAFPGENRPPLAEGGSSRTVAVDSNVMLDGRESFDPDGDSIGYRWEILSGPTTPAIAGNGSPSAFFVPRAAGEYEVQLTVIDPAGLTGTDQFTVRAVPAAEMPPTAVAGVDQTVRIGTSVVLDGSASADGAGGLLEGYTWRFLDRPAGSTAALQGAGTVSPRFLADLEGTYRIELQVESANGLTDTDEVSVVANAGEGLVLPLSFRAVDAEYTRPLDRLVAVAAGPNALHIVDALGDGTQTVALPLPPTSVSVGPDGKQAAVGHDGWISLVDLESATLLDSLEVTADVIDVVLAGNGWVYAFPRRDQWESIYGVEIATGEQAASSGRSIYAGTLAKLHPSGTKMYGADNGLSPSDLERYSFADGAPVIDYDSPYHGDYAMCGNLWFSDDGRRIFTRCGNVFRASDVREDDMTYNGSLGEGQLTFVDHSSAAGQVAVIGTSGSTWDRTPAGEVRFHGDQFLDELETRQLPDFPGASGSSPSQGRFAFFSADGAHLVVVVQAQPGAGVLDDGLVVWEL
jgi:chitinase